MTTSRPEAATQTRARVSPAMYLEIFLCQMPFLLQPSLFSGLGTGSKYADLHTLRLGFLCNIITITIHMQYYHSTGSMHLDCNWTTKFCSQRTSHMEPSATSTTVTRPVGEHLHAGTENTPVFDCQALLRHFRDFGIRYKYPDLLINNLSSFTVH